jgi:large subunit ribosomal protein L13
MNTTVRLKASEIYKDWHVIDAAGRPLGRVASEAATLLRGKHKPAFEPHLDAGDFVIVVNASKVRVSGNKEHQIKYYRHSGFPGGLRTRTYTEQMARFPDRVVEQAIWGMLPDGPLGKKMLKHLKVYAGPNHPHASQIAFTEKAQAARAEATESLKTKERKAPGLRPLSIPQAGPSDGGGAVGDTTPRSRPKAAPKPARGKAPKAAPEATVAAQLEATSDTVLTSESPTPAAAAVNEDVVLTQTATPAEAAVDQGEEIAAEAPKPKRARKPLAEATTGDAGAAPKTTRTRKPKAEAEPPAEAAADEKKKPTRRRTTAKSEE